MPTVNINVSLDTSANPPVVLTNRAGASARSQQANSGDTIRWQKHDSNDNFDISSLEPTGAGQAFSSPAPGGSGQWLSSEYQPPDSAPTAEFAYTLTVTSNGTEYSTTEQEDEPDNGRPVIRN